MGRIIALLYGAVAYGGFLLVFLYLIGFLGNFGLLPRTVDAGGMATPLGQAILINLGLIALFGLPHTIMARPGFKKAWTKVIPKSIERSTYVMQTNLLLIFFFWQWRPMTDVVWQADSTWAQYLLWGVFFLGFGLVVFTTFLIDHFELFGIKQVLNNFMGKISPPPGFQVNSLYRIVRHPLYVGWILSFWGGPTMTTGHLLFAIGMTGYILIAIRYEERDMVTYYGAAYEEYRGRVPMLVPRPGKMHDKVRAEKPHTT